MANRDLTAGVSTFTYVVRPATYNQASATPPHPDYTVFTPLNVYERIRETITPTTYIGNRAVANGGTSDNPQWYDPRTESGPAAALEGAPCLTRWRVSLTSESGYRDVAFLRQDNAADGALYLLAAGCSGYRVTPSDDADAATGVLLYPGSFAALYSTSGSLSVGYVSALTANYSLSVVSGPESVTTEAGTFTDCWRCSYSLPSHRFDNDGSPCVRFAAGTLWFPPSVGNVVRRQEHFPFSDTSLNATRDRRARIWELEAYT